MRKLIIVARDKTGQISLWRYSTYVMESLHMDLCGMWESAANHVAINEDIETHTFKSLFGFTPRKGSKSTLEIISKGGKKYGKR